MGQPVKLSDGLVLDARLVGQLSERSIAGQIEFWASLGRAIEPLLEGDKARALRASHTSRPVAELLESVDSAEGRQRVADYLNETPFPHYEVAPDRPGLLVRVDQDGTRKLGRFVDRVFRPLN